MVDFVTSIGSGKQQIGHSPLWLSSGCVNKSLSRNSANLFLHSSADLYGFSGNYRCNISRGHMCTSSILHCQLRDATRSTHFIFYLLPLQFLLQLLWFRTHNEKVYLIFQLWSLLCQRFLSSLKRVGSALDFGVLFWQISFEQ